MTSKSRIDLYKVHGSQPSRPLDHVTKVHSFSQSQTSSYRGSSGRCLHGVQSINVKTEMNLTTSSFINGIKSFLDNIINAKFVNIRHEVSRYVQLLQYLSLRLLDISEANVNYPPGDQ